ncbi:hypothetical protein ACTQ1D_02035 [Parafannyhessea umbonata]|uniref:hypothetical protein n=1 Tax=Parafannyhessea umbonata TaxID=604330 RepID=UPI003F98B925
MSANLWDASTANYKPDADGVYALRPHDEVACQATGTSALAENQMVHMGASLRGVDAGYVMPFVEYKDAAGSLNWVGFPHWTPTDEWQRFEGSCFVPSGMTPAGFGFNVSGATGDIEVANPVWSYGSPLVLAISSSTLAWSAGILATVRYYQLAAPTAATPTVPTSSSSLGSWTETEPTTDVTKVLWTCDRTVYADGTESWSKASKSTSYEAAKDAMSTATDAQNKAAALATVIHDGADGVSVGRSADGGATYPQGRTRQSSDAFEVLDNAGKTLSSFSKDKVRLGIGSSTSEIDMVDGHGRIFGYLDPQMADPGDGITELRISSDKFISVVGANEASIGAVYGPGYEFTPSATVTAGVEFANNTVTADVRIAAHAIDGMDAGYATKSTITMVAKDGATLNGRPLLTEPTVLFNNPAQALDTAIYLSDSAANYRRLKIFYATDDNEWSSVEVYDPDGKEVSLWAAHYNHVKQGSGIFSQMWMKSKTVTISGRVIDTSKDSSPDVNYNRGQWNGRSTWEDKDKIGIKRVEGYTW